MSTVVDYETGAGRDAHVVPVNADDETTDHESKPNCWCQPVVSWENVVNGARVYVHRRFMDGPAIEPSEGGVIDTHPVS